MYRVPTNIYKNRELDLAHELQSAKPCSSVLNLKFKFQMELSISQFDTKQPKLPVDQEFTAHVPSAAPLLPKQACAVPGSTTATGSSSGSDDSKCQKQASKCKIQHC